MSDAREVILVCHPQAERVAAWIARLAPLLPAFRLAAIDEAVAPERVRYAVVWKPSPGALAPFTALRAVVSLGAGIDHIPADALPAHRPPILRTTGEALTQRMREYVCLQVLRHHRDMPQLAAAQRRAEWQPQVTPPAPERRVGVMGLGLLGSAAATSLAALGFDTRGWARSPHQLGGVTTFAGDELNDFLAGCEILVCLLPLTDATRDILDHRLLARLPRGAGLINAGRGEHLVEADLLDALASARLSHATLDVFRQEPLPADHPFWHHPQITVTPHIASMIDAPTGSRLVAENIRRFEQELADSAAAGGAV
ncbi:2-hydroxyacid dehydrogenase [Kushneria aurantia]|uniref:2-hydroxyacid dehydrogenase n=1 Tax=Kushneria aurantia TaxID=504092 RepID=A0ABV6G0A4_9GAMM|nr:glyoxylate/hydroxypyruvate reductase A [Kushneria aurantia]